MGSSHEIVNVAEAEFLVSNEGNMYTIAMQDRDALPWSKAILRTQKSLSEPGRSHGQPRKRQWFASGRR
jgi:hypothetical protein